MYTPWSSYFRLGVVHFMAYPEVGKDESRMLPTIAQVAADADFEVLETKGVRDPALRKQIRQLCEAAHLDVAYAAQPLVLGGLNPNSLDEDQRQKALVALKAGIDEAEELGAEGFALLSGPDPGPAQRAAGLARLEESLVDLSKYAAGKNGMPVILEVFDRDIDKKAIAGPTAEVAALARRIREQAPNFGLMVDLSHLPLLSETPAEALSAAADTLVHIHIGNAIMDAAHPFYGDHHPRFGVPGGANDVAELAEFLRELFRIGYLAEGRTERPIISFEVKPLPGESSEAVLAGAKRTLKAAWALV